jgi:hypothetical protein
LNIHRRGPTAPRLGGGGHEAEAEAPRRAGGWLVGGSAPCCAAWNCRVAVAQVQSSCRTQSDPLATLSATALTERVGAARCRCRTRGSVG